MAAASAAGNVAPSRQTAPACERGPARERHVIVVCTGESCAEAGSSDLVAELNHQCRHAADHVRVGTSRCMGHCQLAPAVMGDGRMMGWVSPKRLRCELQRLGIT
jgi:NADH:ubiquinone oxidoreductase subunit E